MKRILLAALGGGILVFVWGAIAHMLIPIGDMGMSTLENEDAVLEAFRSNIPRPGMYFFPGWDWSREMTPEQESTWMEKHRNGPAGLLIYRPKGGEPMPPSMLVSELISNILGAFILALVAASLIGSYIRRALLLSLVGLFAWLAISISAWIWYGYPFAYSVGEGLEVYIGTLLAGLVVAKLVPAPSGEAKNA